MFSFTQCKTRVGVWAFDKLLTNTYSDAHNDFAHSILGIAIVFRIALSHSAGIAILRNEISLQKSVLAV